MWQIILPGGTVKWMIIRIRVFLGNTQVSWRIEKS
jgi:hypothetical protein